MAARLNTRQSEKCRDAIKGTLLIKSLQKHAFGEIDMSTTQVQAAKILLDKLISNAPTDINANVDNNLTIVLHNPDAN